MRSQNPPGRRRVETTSRGPFPLGSVAFGFNVAILFALSLYAVAFAVFRKLPGAVPEMAGKRGSGDLFPEFPPSRV